MFGKDFQNIPNENGISFQKSIRPVITLAHIFSLLPLRGSMGNQSSSIKYLWKSTQTAYAVLTIIGCGIMLGITICWLFDSSMDFDKIGVFMFYAANFCGAILFVVIAQSWSNLINHFEKVENRLPVNKLSSERINSEKYIKLITIFIMTLGLSKYAKFYSKSSKKNTFLNYS